jgi:hypothetical protein
VPEECGGGGGGGGGGDASRNASAVTPAVPAASLREGVDRTEVDS